MVSGAPDVAFITLEFPSGIVANVDVRWLVGSKVRRTVVAGSEKLLVYDDCVARQGSASFSATVATSPELQNRSCLPQAGPGR